LIARAEKGGDVSPDEERDDNAGVIALPPLIFALPLLAGLALDRLAPVALVPRRSRALSDGRCWAPASR